MMRNFAYNSTEASHISDKENFPDVGLSTMLFRYRKARKCLSSKAALMVLMWIFLVQMVYLFIINLNSYHFLINSMNIQYYRIARSSFPAVFVFLYPIAGLLADLKFGRYKVIQMSLWMLVVGTPLVLLGAAFLAVVFQFSEYTASLTVAGGILLVPGLVLFVCSFVAFNANVIQFGLDQLHDFPAEDQVIFIKWYIWTYQVALLLLALTENIFNLKESFPWISYYYTLGSILTAIALMLMSSLYIAHRNKKWFFRDYKNINPYKLVFKVTRFAWQHKVPVSRSAFTYCEDEQPSGLDLSKNKYGGPFSTEQVEDVKAFYGIHRILFSLGPVFFLDFAASRESAIFKYHIHEWTGEESLAKSLKLIFLDIGMLYNFEVVFFYPLYILIFRPLVSYYIPRTLSLMGIGMLIYILAILSSLGMDIIVHQESANLTCMFKPNGTNYAANDTSTGPSLVVSSLYYIIIVQQTAYTFSNVMIMTSMYEFIFAQCPHAMKGLVMGLSFTIIGIFKALGSVFIFPFVFYWNVFLKPSCGTVYYAANIVIGTVALIMYIYQAKSYKNRIRDEPCHVRRYVEEYYTKITEEH